MAYSAADLSRVESMGPTTVTPTLDITGGGVSVVHSSAPAVATWVVGGLAVLAVIAVVYLVEGAR